MLCCTSETVNLKVEEVKGLMLPFTLTSHWKKGFIQFRYKGRCKMIKRQEVTCIVDTGLPTTYNKWNAEIIDNKYEITTYNSLAQ